MKRILFITSENPEDYDIGDRIYTWNLLQGVKYAQDSYLHVLCYTNKEYYNNQQNSKLLKIADKITYIPFKHKSNFRKVLSFYPAFIANRKRKSIIDAAKKILHRDLYDVVMVNHFKMAFIIDILRNFHGTKIYIGHNIEYQVSLSIYQNEKNPFFKLAYLADYFKTKYWERRYLSEFDVLTAICDFDMRELKRMHPFTRVVVLRPVTKLDTLTPIVKNTSKIILCGSFTWVAKRINLYNLINCKNIHLLAENGLELNIVGRTYPEDVKHLNTMEGIHATGGVESVQPYYENAEIAIIPEQTGGGFKLKIAEAVQNGIPMVAIKGAVTDDIIKPGLHYEEASDFDDLIEKVILLHKDEAKRQIYIENTAKLFHENYCIESLNKTIFEAINYKKNVHNVR